MLSFPPSTSHPDTWLRLCETKDEAVIRKALPWIAEASKISESPLYHSPRIGDILSELGMKSEAATWWRSRMDLDASNRDAVSCALKVVGTMAPAEARAFLMRRYEAAKDHQGVYAA